MKFGIIGIALSFALALSNFAAAQWTGDVMEFYSELNGWTLTPTVQGNSVTSVVAVRATPDQWRTQRDLARPDQHGDVDGIPLGRYGALEGRQAHQVATPNP